MRFLIVTGQSGAGKSRTASILEDLGYYCVDNLPPELIGQFAEICLATTGRFEKVALVSDVRAGQSFSGLLDAMDALDAKGVEYSVVYVEAATEVIVHRYKETRRSHPLSKDGTPLQDAVIKEKQLLARVRERANYLIDTSALTTAGLRSELIRLFEGDEPQRAMVVNVQSFGFKYGLPMDADLVFDVRFLPNPYYIAELRQKTGLMPEVRDFVFSYQQTADYMTRVEDLLAFSLPLYFEEGKTELVIAVGCTGGRHRSVAVARAIGEYVAKRGFPTVVNHRDIDRG
ncbi:MAG: RNase adapter RapZ [Oscillospiraceae bacterium]|nr:RNase adapter RapZ [Oscillospiraceae bacterium]